MISRNSKKREGSRRTGKESRNVRPHVGPVTSAQAHPPLSVLCASAPLRLNNSPLRPCGCKLPTSKNKTLLTIYPPHLVKRVIDDAICEDVLVTTCKIRCDKCGVTFLATVPFPKP